MKNIFMIMFCVLCNSSYAELMAKNAKDISGYFSDEVVQRYELYADSENKNLIYFSVKNAVIDTDQLSENPKIYVHQVEPNIFDSELKANLFFDLYGSKKHAEKLFQEAESLGFTTMPAPVFNVSINLLINGFLTNSSGSFEAICTYQKVRLAFDIEVDMPYCSAPGEDGVMLPIQGFWSVYSKGLEYAKNIDTRLEVDLHIQKEFSPIVSDSLLLGLSWDNFFSGSIVWNHSKSREIKLGSAWVDWLRVYSASIKYIKDYDNILTRNDVISLGRSLLLDPELRGAFIFWLEPGLEVGDWWDPNAELNEELFERIIRAVLKSEKDNIFYSLDVRDVSGSINEYTFININYKKIQESRYEVIELLEPSREYHPQSQTFLSVNCVIGPVNGTAEWVTNDSRCNSLR